MTDHNAADKWPDDDAPPGRSGGLRRRVARGLHLQQIDEVTNEDVYAGIGTELRAERQRRDLTIADVSASLRIQKSHLSALEEGRTNDLPGPTYAIGFLRTYSEFLDLDGVEIIRQYKTEETLTPNDRRLVFPEPVEEARRPGLSLALISLIVAGAIYGGWIFLEQRRLLPIEIVAEPPQRLAPYQAAAKAPAVTPAIPSIAAPVAATVEAQQVAPALATSPATEIVKTIPAPEGSAAGPTLLGAPDRVAIAALNPAPAETDVATETATDVATAPAAQQKLIGEGERAAAAGVSGLANTGEPANVFAAVETALTVDSTQPETTATPGDVATQTPLTPAHTPTDINSLATPKTEAETAATILTARAPETDPNSGSVIKSEATLEAMSDTDPVQTNRVGSDVDAAPTMPAIQAAIAPPPPAAPAAPVRPRPETSGEIAADSADGRASLATATEGLGYRPQAYGAINQDARVILRARVESWVQIQGAKNELLLTRMLRPGDSYHAPNRTDLVLMTGNAGAVEITVDGETLGTLGPIGQVRRNIKLNAEHLRGRMSIGEGNNQ